MHTHSMPEGYPHSSKQVLQTNSCIHRQRQTHRKRHRQADTHRQLHIHVSSRSGVATLRTAIHLLITLHGKWTGTIGHSTKLNQITLKCVYLQTEPNSQKQVIEYKLNNKLLTVLQCFHTVGRCQEENPVCKNWVMRSWCGYLSAARCRLFA